MTLLNYKMSPTLEKFHDDDNYIRLIIGPVGSGKSVGCCWELFFRACEQPPNEKGIRRSRHVVVRNTLPQLETTTMATWRDWFGTHVFPDAPITGRSPYKQNIRFPLPDKTEVDMEVIFMALDGPLDVGKLMSLEVTWIWFNELRYIDEVIFREAQTRTGRFPPKKDGGENYRHGIIADTNAPDVGGWIYKMAEEIRPENVSVFKQPSGISDKGENLENLPEGYYQNMMIGKPKEWVNVYVHGQYGYFHDGANVYDGVWNDDFHFHDNTYNLIPGTVLVGGIDASGRSPAAVVLQRNAMGQYQCIWELCVSDIGAVAFSRVLRKEVQSTFPKHNIQWWGDPAGAFKAQTDERTYFDILKAEGINVLPAQSIRPSERIEAVNSILSRNVGGLPALSVDRGCPKLRQGFNGGYRFKMIGSGDAKRTMPDPDKNEYSHVHDALQYAVVGTGELNYLKRRNSNDFKVVDYDTDW